VKRLFRLGEAPTDTCDIHVPQAVFMPNVVGMSLTKAKKLLSDAHLTVQTVSDSGSLKPAGTVTKQDFAADKPILQGTTVTLHVSAGQATMVPKLAGHTLEEAQALLATAGLTADFTSQSSDTVAANVVISQEPGSGSVVGKGSTVHFVVSSGPATPPST
jgi:serine/threonine-protein kinase